ncbi:lipopolysaccharide biosynthesis protein [Luteimonas salinisoli]|uniref:lipopolysaccharide biosynthesis protein n=1 Tax=Luteimonas salinisoli TaxID=2752307 RepID=UPI003CE5B02D
MILAWGAAQLALAAFGTWLARRYALRRRLLDQPGERRSHSVATPRGGGIAIVACLLAGALLLAWWFPAERALLLAGSAALLLVAAVGWIDDHRALSAWLRLAVHAVAGLLLAGAALRSGHGLPVAAAGFAATVVLVNVWNFMDGIDGLAASQCAIAALGYGLLALLGLGGGAAVLLAFSLAAACAGFLPFNFPRAAIFLGDVGSGALGLALAWICLLIAPRLDGPMSWTLLLLPLSAFLVDAALTLGTRMLRGEAWWRPHVQHAYQCWARRIGRHPPVTLAYAAWGGAAVLTMLAARGLDAAYIIALATAWGLGAGGAWVILRAGSPPPGKERSQE